MYALSESKWEPLGAPGRHVSRVVTGMRVCNAWSDATGRERNEVGEV